MDLWLCLNLIFGEDAGGNNYIITVDANDVNRFYADNEEEAIEKYERFKEDWENSEHGDLTQVFYESEDVSVDDNTEDKLFSGVEFEEKIPHRMRFKQWDIIINDIDEGHDLYWVTQQFFGKEEVEQFAKAFKELPFDKAYVTVRDLSTYQFNEDEKNKVFVIINNHGRAAERINSYNYENKIKENGYDFDYETGKWSNEE